MVEFDKFARDVSTDYKLYNLLKICGIRTPSVDNYRFMIRFVDTPHLHSETLKVKVITNSLSVNSNFFTHEVVIPQ